MVQAVQAAVQAGEAHKEVHKEALEAQKAQLAAQLEALEAQEAHQAKLMTKEDGRRQKGSRRISTPCKVSQGTPLHNLGKLWVRLAAVVFRPMGARGALRCFAIR